MYYFVKNLLEALFISIKIVLSILSDSNFLNKYEHWSLRILDVMMQGYQQAPRVYEPKDMKM